MTINVYLDKLDYACPIKINYSKYIKGKKLDSIYYFCPFCNERDNYFCKNNGTLFSKLNPIK